MVSHWMTELLETSKGNSRDEQPRITMKYSSEVSILIRETNWKPSLSIFQGKWTTAILLAHGL